MLGRIVQNIVRNIGILYNNVNIIGKKTWSSKNNDEISW